jgi:hypothetical protein
LLIHRVSSRCLGKLSEFNAEFILPIEKGQKQDASKRQLAEARKGKFYFFLLWFTFLNFSADALILFAFFSSK